MVGWIALALIVPVYALVLAALVGALPLIKQQRRARKLARELHRASRGDRVAEHRPQE